MPNRYKEHLVVFSEDRPYREIINGAKQALNLNEALLDVKSPTGGWAKVFNTLEENHQLLLKLDKMHVLLLMDFDNQFSSRQKRLRQLIDDKPYQERVFLLGIDGKESENLRKNLNHMNFEDIGKALVDDCPHHQNIIWQNDHLACNHMEIQRMQESGLFSWLFHSNT